jgi:hypothetical protein
MENFNERAKRIFPRMTAFRPSIVGPKATGNRFSIGSHSCNPEISQHPQLLDSRMRRLHEDWFHKFERHLYEDVLQIVTTGMKQVQTTPVGWLLQPRNLPGINLDLVTILTDFTKSLQNKLTSGHIVKTNHKSYKHSLQDGSVYTPTCVPILPTLPYITPICIYHGDKMKADEDVHALALKTANQRNRELEEVTINQRSQILGLERDLKQMQGFQEGLILYVQENPIPVPYLLGQGMKALSRGHTVR